ncbi:uncharacterized protein LOC126204365 [Schistocerca nitens]|uniref:uncharacterized protein LOC126204365 n=1 Tax=Schistocerca nitens TaxID=7011 RepID=UPI002117C1C0|nr:uncharacterized protein LOC126204365 [Schistocerca nitens]
MVVAAHGRHVTSVQLSKGLECHHHNQVRLCSHAGLVPPPLPLPPSGADVVLKSPSLTPVAIFLQACCAPSADARTGGWRLEAGLGCCCAGATGARGQHAVPCCAVLCCGRLSPHPPVPAESPASVHLEFRQSWSRQLPLLFPMSPAMQTLLLLVAASMLSAALGRPTLYHVNDNDKLEPVMVPVSSTVIPLPIYQVSSGVEFGGKDYKNHKPDEPIKLITATKKKTSVKKVEGNTGE